jgi:hypothetical protein
LFPLDNLNGKELNGYRVCLGQVKQLRLSGWKGFKLHLEDPDGILSTAPVVEGIYSSGAKDGVKPWLDLVYLEELEFLQEEKGKESLNLSLKGLDRKLFKYLGEIIPPGGHLMVSYEEEHGIHIDTVESLRLKIPPVLTPLGLLIFLAGFQYVKDWYLAEGGHEGPRKLWGEKAPDESWAKNFYEKTAEQVFQFLKRTPNPAYKGLEQKARTRSEEVLKITKGDRSAN